MNECQRDLSPSRLLFGDVSNQTISVGSITVFTKEITSFIVTNGLEQ
jgi:hypothetical protein